MITFGTLVVILTGFYQGCYGRIIYHSTNNPNVYIVKGSCKGIDFTDWITRKQFKLKGE